MDEKSILVSASRLYNAMCTDDGARRKESTRLLQAELTFFDRAMALQVAAFMLLDPHLPFSRLKPYAAIALGFSTFDHLKQGSRSLLDGYCLVAMTLARNILESVVFLTAVGVGAAADCRGQPNEAIDKWLNQWWRDKFQGGRVQDLIACVDKEMRRGSAGASQSEWARSMESLWRILRSWAHADWVPISTSGGAAEIGSGALTTPAVSFGGHLPSAEQSKLVGYLYSKFAVDALFAFGLAFLPQLTQHPEWWRMKDGLVDEHMHWSQSMKKPYVVEGPE